VDGRRQSTRAGEAVRPRSNNSLLLGGVAVGVVLIVALAIAVAGSRGEKVKKKAERTERPKIADLTPRAADPSSVGVHSPEEEAPRPLDSKLVKNRKPRKPASYWVQFVDKKLWEEARGYAIQAEKMIRELRNTGKTPPGLNKKQTKEKAKELLAMALEKANEFMAPVEDRVQARREEAQDFLDPYDETMLRWQRRMRDITYGGRK